MRIDSMGNWCEDSSTSHV